MDEFYTVKEVCRKLKVARDGAPLGARRLVSETGALFATRSGPSRFSKALVDAWIEARTAAAAS